MPVQINEIIIRAIVTTDDQRSARDIIGDKKTDDTDEERKREILELIDESLKNKKER